MFLKFLFKFFLSALQFSKLLIQSVLNWKIYHYVYEFDFPDLRVLVIGVKSEAWWEVGDYWLGSVPEPGGSAISGSQSEIYNEFKMDEQLIFEYKYFAKIWL